MPNFQDSTMNEEYLDVIKSYRPMDDTFMRNIFRNSPEITESVLRILMDKPDLEVIYMLRKTHTLACGMKAAFLYLDR